MQTIIHRCDYIVCTYLDYYKSDQGLRSWLQKEVKYSKGYKVVSIGISIRLLNILYIIILLLRNLLSSSEGRFSLFNILEVTLLVRK